jgi:KaiC/GvpD/RAD55 family RecA-like ATPase
MSDFKIGTTNVTTLLKDKYKKMKNTGWVSLIEVPADNHLEINTEALKILINEMGYKCIYITLGKTSAELDKMYGKLDVQVENIFYIDAISKMYGESKSDTKKCRFTSGPLDVEAITASVRDYLAVLGAGKKCVFLDSVTTVLLYNSLPRTLRFSQFLTQSLKKTEVTGIMVSIAKGKSTTQLIKELSKLCDEVINIS